MIRVGCRASANCGTPKSNSPWKVESADQEGAGEHDLAEPGPAGEGTARGLPLLVALGVSAQAPSTESEAPPISIRWVGPQRVTSWPKIRCQMSSSGKASRELAPQIAIIRAPIGA